MASEGPGAPTSIRSVRRLIRDLLAHEQATGRPRDVVVLAVDGLGYRVASDAWPDARLSCLRSVFPTSSAPGWLSSLTGQPVDQHGVPGAFFAVEPYGRPSSFLRMRDELTSPDLGTVFRDAAALGYLPIALRGDLEHYPGRWRDLLLAGAHQLITPALFTRADGRPAELDPAELVRRLSQDLAETLPGPSLRWCFLELDTHLHRHGHDGYARQVLAELGALAARLADAGVLVLAHSDHGITATDQDDELANRLAGFCTEHDCVLGGAGRVRWLHRMDPARGLDLPDRLADWLHDLPSVRVQAADELFRPGSLGRRRVGDAVLTATGRRFLVPPGYRYEHGSSTEDEVLTPLACWGTDLPAGWLPAPVEDA